MMDARVIDRDSFIQKIDQYSYADFIDGIPYNEAGKSCKEYADFVLCLAAIESIASAKGVTDDILLPYRGMYESIYFPNSNKRRMEDESMQARVVAPVNASDEAGLISYTIRGNNHHLYTGNYKVIDGKIYLVHDDHKDLICNHIILPVTIFQDAQTRLELIDIAYFRDGEENHQQLKLSEIDEPKKLLKLRDYGVDINRGNAGKLSDYLVELVQMNRGDCIPIIRLVDYLGWVDNTYKNFVPFSSRYLYSKASIYRREYDAVRTRNGNLPGWIKVMNQFRDDEHIEARIILAASFASVLVEPMGCLPFMLDIWGSVSGSGKTVALMTAASVWAKPGSDDGYIKTMNSTDIALEQLAQFCHNYPLLLDELQTVQNRRNFDTLIYQLCEGMPRGRGTFAFADSSCAV